MTKGHGMAMLLEEEEKISKGFIRESLDHSIILVSPDIKEKIESNASFNKLLITALTEISSLLDKEIGGIGYIIEVSVVQDYEYPDWRDNVITVKVPISDDPKYIIKLWKKVSRKVWEKVELIREDAEEIKRIRDNTRIAFDILG